MYNTEQPQLNTQALQQQHVEKNKKGDFLFQKRKKRKIQNKMKKASQNSLFNCCTKLPDSFKLRQGVCVCVLMLGNKLVYMLQELGT